MTSCQENPNLVKTGQKKKLGTLHKDLSTFIGAGNVISP
jgi:hypothetical protein